MPSGQMDVHQDERGAALAGQLQALLARLGLQDLVALVGEHVAGQLAVLVVVLDDEDQLVGHAVTGIVKVKVEPWPGWLLAQMRPPCSSTNLRESVRPSPVPSCFLV